MVEGPSVERPTTYCTRIAEVIKEMIADR